ncbi:hypothetical protein MC885_018145 [Smutsia gigantea]|nr:hypothetical protein MC885_018145 [Smutsia gigantea]
MDTVEYSKWDDMFDHEGHRGRWGRRLLFLVLAVVVSTVLWALILSVLFSKASTERGALLDRQDLLRANGSGTQAQLQTARAQLAEAQAKLIQQQDALRELGDRVTQGLAEAGRDRENIRMSRTEGRRGRGTLHEGLAVPSSAGPGAVTSAGSLWLRPWAWRSAPHPARRSPGERSASDSCHHAGSCEQCPTPWLPFQGSCYLFSKTQATWDAAQQSCAGAGAHLVIIGDLDEQGFLSQNTRGHGYWLGLRAVRRGHGVQGYQWVDGVTLSFSHWNLGEPNDSRGQEDCIMMLHTGMWNDAPCGNERDNWICEKRRSC